MSDQTIRKTSLPEFEVLGDRPVLTLTDLTHLVKMLRTATVSTLDIGPAYKALEKVQALYSHVKNKHDVEQKNKEG